MGGGSCSEGYGFESWRCLLNEHDIFSYWFVVKIQKSIFPKILFWCEPNRFWFNSKTLTANIDVKTDSSFVTGFNWWRGAAITQWIHLCLPSSLPGFEFRALNLSFYHLLSKFCYLSCEKNENKQKEAGFGQLKKFINDDWLGNMLEKIMKLFPAF